MEAFLANGSLINGLGDSPAAAAHAISAGLSSVQASPFANSDFKPIKLSLVPAECLPDASTLPPDAKPLQRRLERLVDALITENVKPYLRNRAALFLTGPERLVSSIDTGLPVEILAGLNDKHDIDVDLRASKVFSNTGRAGFFQGLKTAMETLYQGEKDHVVVAAVDSAHDHALLALLDSQKRLLAENRMTGFCPGEGGALLVLSRNEQPFAESEQVVSFKLPALASEPGAFYAKEPCLGDGLCSAVEQALEAVPAHSVHRLYSSMNGEPYWAKELGILQIRHAGKFHSSLQVEHPAEAWGDLGSAYGPSVFNILAYQTPGRYLVCASSDSNQRAACLINVRACQ